MRAPAPRPTAERGGRGGGPRVGGGRGGGRGGGHGGGRGGGHGGRGYTPKSEAELDADMDSYRTQQKQ